jgi:hypothetical protein
MALRTPVKPPQSAKQSFLYARICRVIEIFAWRRVSLRVNPAERHQKRCQENSYSLTALRILNRRVGIVVQGEIKPFHAH